MPKFDTKTELLARLYLVLLGFIVVAVLIGWKIVDISVIEGEHWRSKNENGLMKLRPVKTQRGNIYGDDGSSLLATSVEFFEIRMDPVAPSQENFDKYIDGLCRKLAEFPGGKTMWEWKSKIVGARQAYFSKKRGGSRNLLIVKQVDHIDYKKIKSYPLFELGQHGGGIKTVKRYIRKRPYKDLAARTIGLTRDQYSVGLENSFNSTLKGKERMEFMKFIKPDLWVSVYDPTDFEIVKGLDIVTTINVPLQDVVHHELLNGIRQENAEGGTAILMEVKTGRIKAMANLKLNKQGEYGEFHNYAIAERSEPGSTIKAASVLALLEDGLATPNTIVDFSMGRKKFYDKWMSDSKRHGISRSTLKEAVEISSNVGIASALHEAYNSRDKQALYIDKLRQFGIHRKTGVEIEGEPEPFIKHPVENRSIWYGTTIPWMAHGYESLLTPLQILGFYNTIANDGVRMKPQIVKAISQDEEIKKTFEPEVDIKSIAKKENIEAVQHMLEGVVERGTARSLKADRYNFAGKTGTTKVDYDKAEHKYNASFAGYWPSEDPEYSLIVVVYGLKGSKYYGSIVAGPIFKRIADWTYAIKGGTGFAAIRDDISSSAEFNGSVYGHGSDYEVIFDNTEIDFKRAGNWIRGESASDGSVVSGKARIKMDIVPDMKGMGPRDAVYVLENLGMKVRLDGVGRVARQSIRPGSTIENQEIVLYLN